MNPEIKAKWVAALRSGEYQQTRNTLRRNNSVAADDDGPGVSAGYCCLGVLCEIGIQDGVIERRDHNPKGGVLSWSLYRWHGSRSPYWNDATLSGEMLEWAGLAQGQQIDLAERNDDGATFAQLADYIEATL